MKKPIRWAMAILLTFLVAMYASLGSVESVGLHSLPVAEIKLSADSGVQPLGSDGADHAPPPPLGSRHAGDSPTRMVMGFVLDSRFEAPLLATIQLRGGGGVSSSRRDGKFSLPVPFAGGALITVTARGYLSRELELPLDPGSEPVRILMDGLRSARVRVEDSDGSPIQGVEVSWQAATAPARNAVEWWRPEALLAGQVNRLLTGADGWLAVEIGGPVLAVVRDASSGFTQTFQLEPGEEQIVVIPACGQKLVFVDADSGRPIAGLPVQVWAPGRVGSMPTSMQTGDDGGVQVLAPDLPLMLRLSGNRRFQYTLRIRGGSGHNGTTSVHSQNLIQINSIDCSSPLVVDAKPCGGTMFLRDEETGKPLEGDATVDFWTPKQERAANGKWNPPDDFSSPHRELAGGVWVFALDGGLLRLPCQMSRGLAELEKLENRRESMASSEYQIVVNVRGYAPLHVKDLTCMFSSEKEIPEFTLERASERSLRIRFSDESPMTRGVKIRSPAEYLVCYQSPGRLDGLHGPFDWIGGELELSVQGWSTTIAAARLSSSAVVDITIPGKTGAIDLSGIPPEAAGVAMVAKGKIGESEVEYRPTRVTPGHCVFDGVPAGKYRVGPRPWVRGGELQGLVQNQTGELRRSGVLIVVEPGVTSSASWQDSWVSTIDITGTVRIAGAEEVLPFLFPIYGLGPLEAGKDGHAPRVILGRSRERIGLGPGGQYLIPAWTPVPDLLLVCVGDADGWGGKSDMHVVDAMLPGGSSLVDAGSFELRWEGMAAPGGAEVSYEITTQDFQFPVYSFLSSSRRHWSAGQVLRIHGVPLSVTRFSVEDRYLKVNPEAGVVQRIDVDFYQLPKTADDASR